MHKVASTDALMSNMVRKTTMMLRDAASAVLHNNGPKLHIAADELNDDGFLELTQSKLYITINRSHEKFIPVGCDRGVMLTHETLVTVHENWTSFLNGDSPVFQAHVDKEGKDRAMSPVTFFYDIFYRKLFLLAPSMRKIFMQNMVRQSRFLVSITCECAGLYELLNQSKGLSGIENLTKANADFGIRAEHYGAIATSLKYALQYCNGESLWNTVESSWSDVISFFVVASVCITINNLRDGERKETESFQWAELQRYRANLIKHINATNNHNKNSPQDLSDGQSSNPHSLEGSFHIECDMPQTTNDEILAGESVKNNFIQFHPRRHLNNKTEENGSNQQEPMNPSNKKINLANFGWKMRDSSEEMSASPIGKNSAQYSTNHDPNNISAVTPTNQKETHQASQKMKKAFANAASMVAPWKINFKNNGSLTANCKNVEDLATITCQDLLYLIDRQSPNEMCRKADKYIEVIVKWLNPRCTLSDKRMSLHGAVGVSWKISLADSSDKKIMKIKNSTFVNQLPDLVSAIVGCIEGWEVEEDVSVDSHLLPEPDLQIDALNALCNIARFVQVNFKGHVDLIRMAVHPLLESSDREVREQATLLLSILPVCLEGQNEFSHAAAKICLEAHTLLQQVWPDDDIDMGGHTLEATPVLQHMQNDAFPALHNDEHDTLEKYLHMLSKRVPALMTTVSRLMANASFCYTESKHELSIPVSFNHPRRASNVASVLEHAAEVAALEASKAQKAVFIFSILVIALLERILRMSVAVEKQCQMMEEGKCNGDRSKGKEKTLASSIATITLADLQKAAALLLEAVSTMNGLPTCLHKRVCICLSQYILTMPVEGGLRDIVYQNLNYVGHGRFAGAAPFHLATTVSPSLIDELSLMVGLEVPTGERFCPPASAILSFPIGKNPPFLSRERNCGHGQFVDAETVASGVLALACLTEGYRDLFHLTTKISLENALSIGLKLLIVNKEALEGNSRHSSAEMSDKSDVGRLPPVVVYGPAKRSFMELATKYVIIHSQEIDVSLHQLATNAFMACATDADPYVAKSCRNALLSIWEMSTPIDSSHSQKRNGSSYKAASLLGIPTAIPSNVACNYMNDDEYENERSERSNTASFLMNVQYPRSSSRPPARNGDEGSMKSGGGRNQLSNVNSNNSHNTESTGGCGQWYNEEEGSQGRAQSMHSASSFGVGWSPQMSSRKAETPRHATKGSKH